MLTVSLPDRPQHNVPLPNKRNSLSSLSSTSDYSNDRSGSLSTVSSVEDRQDSFSHFSLHNALFIDSSKHDSESQSKLLVRFLINHLPKNY